MGFRTGAYATVWDVRPGQGNFVDVRISTSRKDRETGKFVQDFGGYVRFVGNAANEASTLKERDRIRIGECDVSNRYDRDKNITYTNCAVFDFEKVDSNLSSTPSNGEKSNPDEFMTIPDEVEDSLPFD